jgi:hypothetical protein
MRDPFTSNVFLISYVVASSDEQAPGRERNERIGKHERESTQDIWYNWYELWREEENVIPTSMCTYYQHLTIVSNPLHESDS